MTRHSLIALLAYDTPEPPSPGQIREVVSEQFGDAVRIESEADGPILQLDIAGGSALIAPGTGPIAADVIGPAVERCWYWREVQECAARHQSHLVVIVKDVNAGSARAKSLLLTRLAGMLGAAFDYSFVYWEPSAAIHSAAAVTESAEQMGEKQLPLRIWVSFGLVTNDDQTLSLHTQGLDALGLYEIEIRGSKRPAENVQGWAFNIAHFVLERGQIVPDGETVGVSQTEFVRVHHLPSAFDPDRTVLFLDLDMEEELAATEDPHQ